MAYELHTIPATALVPAPEPEQGSDFLSGTAGLGKLVHFRNTWLSVACRALPQPMTKTRPSLAICRSVESQGSLLLLIVHLEKPLFRHL